MGKGGNKQDAERSTGKLPCAVAVYNQLRCVPSFTKEAIKVYAEANIAPGARVLSDGLGCFAGSPRLGSSTSPS